MAVDVRGLADRRVLVTGASSGIGAATAELLAAEGAIVGVHYNRHKEAASELVERIRTSGAKAVALPADLLDRDARRALIPQAIAALKGLDALINNAGAIIGTQPILDLAETAWEQTLALNLEAPFFLAQQAFRHMMTTGGGKIINISSVGVKYGGSSTSLHYAAAKSALETVTIGLAKSGAAHHILVNAIRPGIIATPFHADIPAGDLAQRIQLVPLKRAGTPGEVAQMILYLLSRAGDFITGQIFSITGGD